jgi:hypothetical protein
MMESQLIGYNLLTIVDTLRLSMLLLIDKLVVSNHFCVFLIVVLLKRPCN